MAHYGVIDFGKVNYEAFRYFNRHAPLPLWENLSLAEKSAWGVAAAAVIHSVSVPDSEIQNIGLGKGEVGVGT